MQIKLEWNSIKFSYVREYLRFECLFFIKALIIDLNFEMSLEWVKRKLDNFNMESPMFSVPCSCKICFLQTRFRKKLSST